MSKSYTQIHLQIIFAVKYRAAVLDKSWRHQVQSVIGNLINESGCSTYIVNGVEDHMHCFLRLKPTVTICELVKRIKAVSSKYINDNNLTRDRFEWQPGYAVFSYRQRDVDQIFNYVKNQETHHQKISLRKEYEETLKEFQINYEEDGLFDHLV
jgi:REP element-mobilizing transposase RayT